MKTSLPKESEIVRQWHVIDAAGKPVGRLAVRITELLRGKNKPTFTPHIDTGDFVVVINASQVKLTGSKEEKKEYQFYSRYPGGLKRFTAGQIRAKRPAYLITHAVRDMLPRNHMSRQLFRRLKVYAGADHPHVAQKPEALKD